MKTKKERGQEMSKSTQVTTIETLKNTPVKKGINNNHWFEKMRQSLCPSGKFHNGDGAVVLISARNAQIYWLGVYAVGAKTSLLDTLLLNTQIIPEFDTNLANSCKVVYLRDVEDICALFDVTKAALTH